jgi:hypothetical protein
MGTPKLNRKKEEGRRINPSTFLLLPTSFFLLF